MTTRLAAFRTLLERELNANAIPEALFRDLAVTNGVDKECDALLDTLLLIVDRVRFPMSRPVDPRKEVPQTVSFLSGTARRRYKRERENLLAALAAGDFVEAGDAARALRTIVSAEAAAQRQTAVPTAARDALTKLQQDIPVLLALAEEDRWAQIARLLRTEYVFPAVEQKFSTWPAKPILSVTLEWVTESERRGYKHLPDAQTAHGDFLQEIFDIAFFHSFIEAVKVVLTPGWAQGDANGSLPILLHARVVYPHIWVTEEDNRPRCARCGATTQAVVPACPNPRLEAAIYTIAEVEARKHVARAVFAAMKPLMRQNSTPGAYKAWRQAVEEGPHPSFDDFEFNHATLAAETQLGKLNFAPSQPVLEKLDRWLAACVKAVKTGSELPKTPTL